MAQLCQRSKAVRAQCLERYRQASMAVSLRTQARPSLAAIVRSKIVADSAVVKGLAALGNLVTGETRVRHVRDPTTLGAVTSNDLEATDP